MHVIPGCDISIPSTRAEKLAVLETLAPMLAPAGTVVTLYTLTPKLPRDPQRPWRMAKIPLSFTSRFPTGVRQSAGGFRPAADAWLRDEWTVRMWDTYWRDPRAPHPICGA